jgi:hypothetical protein
MEKIYEATVEGEFFEVCLLLWEQQAEKRLQQF